MKRSQRKLNENGNNNVIKMKRSLAAGDSGDTLDRAQTKGTSKETADSNDNNTAPPTPRRFANLVNAVSRSTSWLSTKVKGTLTATQNTLSQAAAKAQYNFSQSNVGKWNGSNCECPPYADSTVASTVVSAVSSSNAGDSTDEVFRVGNISICVHVKSWDQLGDDDTDVVGVFSPLPTTAAANKWDFCDDAGVEPNSDRQAVMRLVWYPPQLSNLSVLYKSALANAELDGSTSVSLPVPADRIEEVVPYLFEALDFQANISCGVLKTIHLVTPGVEHACFLVQALENRAAVDRRNKFVWKLAAVLYLLLIVVAILMCTYGYFKLFQSQNVRMRGDVHVSWRLSSLNLFLPSCHNNPAIMPP